MSLGVKFLSVYTYPANDARDMNLVARTPLLGSAILLQEKPQISIAEVCYACCAIADGRFEISDARSGRGGEARPADRPRRTA